MKILKEIPLLKFRPNLNLKSPEEVNKDAKKLQKNEKEGT